MSGLKLTGMHKLYIIYLNCTIDADFDKITYGPLITVRNRLHM
jgi:hypothetical protein